MKISNKFHQGPLTIIISWGVLQDKAVNHKKKLNLVFKFQRPGELARRPAIHVHSYHSYHPYNK